MTSEHKDLTADQTKHLDYIQAAISRMNNNSFQMKGWMVAIVSALLAIFAGDRQNHAYALIAILPTVIFWFLDTYYLWQERKFRGLYNDVAGVSENPKEIKVFAMRPDLYTGGKYSFWDVFTSVTILYLYFPVVVILVGVYVLL
jgi:hypothetical protein